MSKTIELHQSSSVHVGDRVHVRCYGICNGAIVWFLMPYCEWADREDLDWHRLSQYRLP